MYVKGAQESPICQQQNKAQQIQVHILWDMLYVLNPFNSDSGRKYAYKHSIAPL